MKRLWGALVRATLVATLVSLPALLLPDISVDATPLVVLLALLGGGLTFAEYAGAYPSLIEFRDAPPFNRLRFGTLFLTVLVLALIGAGRTQPTELSQALHAIGTLLGRAGDFPYSPVRLMVLMMPDETPTPLLDEVRTAAGFAYPISLLAMATFAVLVKLRDWPMKSGAFNVWVNLPLFDPTTGGDVVPRLRRDAFINLALGFLLPFLIPAVVRTTSELLGPISMTDPQTLIWTVSAWAFLPASMIMRGIAMLRIAELIVAKRRRAYAEERRLQTV